MFHMDVRGTDFYDFYYNMVAEVNKNVTKVVGKDILNRPISDSAKSYINNKLNGNFGKTGPSEFGMIGVKNFSTGQIEYANALDMVGISATVSADLASKILERAIYYCPKDTGTLASSGRIEQNADGSCRIYFDCPYAYYVHEHTWKYHKPPTCAKFLTIAINDFEGVS